MSKQIPLNMMLKAQRGISVVQIAVTILVGAILILGGLAAFRYVTGASMNNEAADIAQIVTQIKSIRSTNAASLTQTNLGAESSIKAMGLIYQTQGGRKPIYSVTTDGQTPVSVELPNFNQDECREILPKLIAGIDSVAVAGNTAVSGNDNIRASMATLQSQCVNGSNNIVITVS